MSLTAQERDFVHVLREALEEGTRPSSRYVFRRLIERGQSSRDGRSIDRYGPGARFTRLHRTVLQEWDDFKERSAT